MCVCGFGFVCFFFVDREKTAVLDDMLYNGGSSPHNWHSLPDVLSKNRDYVELEPLNGVPEYTTSAILLPHIGLDLADIIQLHTPLPASPTTPVCDSHLDHSMADYQHLSGVASRKDIFMPAETGLLKAAWWSSMHDVDRTNEEMGSRVAVELKSNESSWVALNLAAMYWRIEGNYGQAVECLRRALHHSPHEHRDVALLQLGGIMLQTDQAADARVVTEAALRISDTLYATNFVHGNILASLGDLAHARDAYERAVSLQPDLSAAYAMLEAVTAKIKTLAVGSRRQYEINLRKASMVLSDDLTWENFDYEASENPCADALCKDNSECSNIDGKCHCSEGWLAVDGECVQDGECDTVQCKDNSICRDGRCYCKIGYRVEGTECLQDLCATIMCVDHAECDQDDGRCHCTDPYVLQGAECVEAKCLDVDCRADSVCRGGHCYCNVGFIPKDDACVEDKECGKSQCPLHASCSKTDGHCRCNNGYNADIHKNICRRDGASYEEEDEGMDASGNVGNEDVASAEEAGPSADGSQKKVAGQLGPELAAILRVTKSFCEKITLSVVPNKTADESSNLWLHDTCLYLPLPGSSEEDVKEVLEKLVPKKKPTEKKKRKTPVCSSKEVLPRTYMLDDVLGFANAGSEPWSEPIEPELNAQNHFFQMINFRKRPAVFKGVPESLLLDEVGHRLALRLRKEPFNLRLLDLAVLWWRATGNRREAFECERHFLHWAGKTKSNPDAIDVTSYGYVHISNIFLHAQRIEDAEIFADLALAALPNDPLVIYLYASVQAAAGHFDTSSLALAMFLKDHPRHPPARDLLHAIRCTQLRQDEANRDYSSSVVSELPGGVVEFYGEAGDLKERLQTLRTLLSGRRMNEIARGDGSEAWKDLDEDEKRLAKLVEMQQLAMNLKNDVIAFEKLDIDQARPSKAGDGYEGSKTPKVKRGRRVISVGNENDGSYGDTDTGAADQKVVVVEYPKSPSIPSLITAVAEMFSKKPGASEPRKRLPFEDEAWPTAEDCKGAESESTRFTSTYMSAGAKDIDVRDFIDVRSDLPISSDQYGQPVCNGPVTGKPVHTLEHIDGMSKRATIHMLPEEALKVVLTNINVHRSGGAAETSDEDASSVLPPLPVDEVGERTRLALEKNASNWVALNIAALYWRADGNATQALECLRRAFLHSGSGEKDMSLVGIANVLHLSGHTIDAVTVMQMAIQVAPKIALNHFTMANILYTFGESSAAQAAFFYEATLRFQSDFRPALTRLLQLRCKSKGDS